MTTSYWPGWYCPSHRQPLDCKADVLVCPDGDSFTRTKGIPRFVIKAKYARPFGAQWKKYRLTQLDSYTRTTISEDRASRCLGKELWLNLDGKQILECGCGAGRFTEILLSKGACVTSVDLTEAVDANQENFPQNQNHRIAQADILRLPFTSRQFDIVFCLGVIQHTPNPEQTIACLFEAVKPGGTLVLDHYTHTLSSYTKLAPLFRSYVRCLPPEKGMAYTERLVNALWPLHRLARHSYLTQAILSRLSPVLCYYRTHSELDD